MSEPDNLRHYAHVIDGKVVNVSVWDGIEQYDPGEGVTMVPLPYTEEADEETGEMVRRYTGGIGWTYNAKATKNKFVDNRPQEDPDGLD